MYKQRKLFAGQRIIVEYKDVCIRLGIVFLFLFFLIFAWIDVLTDIVQGEAVQQRVSPSM